MFAGMQCMAVANDASAAANVNLLTMAIARSVVVSSVAWCVITIPTSSTAHAVHPNVTP